MELEEGMAKAKPRVGLWARVYMTSPTFEHLGSVMTLESYKVVARIMPPPLQSRDVSESKSGRRTKW